MLFVKHYFKKSGLIAQTALFSLRLVPGEEIGDDAAQ